MPVLCFLLFKSLVKEEIEKEHFKLCFKGFAPTKEREALIKMYYHFDKTIPIKQIVNALPHIEIVGDKIRIYIHLADRIDAVLKYCLAFILFVGGLLSFPILLFTTKLFIALPLSAIIFFCTLCMAAYFISQTWSVAHAKLIKKALEHFAMTEEKQEDIGKGA